MSKNLKKFVNPKFIKTVDLGLMKRLLARHEGQLAGFPLSLFASEEHAEAAREALDGLLSGPEDTYPEGVRADLHRIADLASASGVEFIRVAAARWRLDLFPELKTPDADAPNVAHDPKNFAIRVFLDEPALFEAAADQMALMTADRLYEFAGRERGIAVDLTAEKVGKFRTALTAVFLGAFHGDYCRVGDYVDGDEINLVIAHGSLVATMPIVDGVQERVISVREITHAVLRFSENTGILRTARIQKSLQPEIIKLFATIILERPDFFDDADARELYTLDPVQRAGFDFQFDHRFAPEIDEVQIIEAAADLIAAGKKGYPRVVRTLRSRDVTGGDALRHLRHTPVDFSGDWRLAEILIRVLFKSKDGKRQPQVTVTIRPPQVVRFRRTKFEETVEWLIERNGLLCERDDLPLIDAAE